MGRISLPAGRHGEIFIASTGDTYRARCYYRDGVGRRRSLTASGTTKKAARDRLRRKLDTANLLAEHAVERLTIGHALDTWLEHTKSRTRLTQQSKDKYADQIERLNPWRALDLDSLDPRAVNRIHVDLVQQHGRSEKTANSVLKLFKSVLDYASTLGMIRDNPAAAVKPYDIERREARAFTEEEERQFLADVKRELPLRFNLFRFMLGTGCRIGEALAVRWQDIDLDTRTLTVNGTVVQPAKGSPFRQAHTKTNEIRRSVLPRGLVAMLHEMQVQQIEVHAENVIFASGTGTLIWRSNVSEDLRLFRAKHAKWAWVTTHSMRRTVNTKVTLKAGQEAAMAQLGHKSAQVNTSYMDYRQRLADNAEHLDI